MRVLHLIDPDSPEGGPCSLRLLGDVTRHLDTAKHHVLVLGGRRAIEAAKSCDVRANAHLTPSRHLPWTASAALREFGDAMQFLGRRIDLVHAWTARSASQAYLTWKGQIPVIATVHAGLGRDLLSRYVMRVLRRSDVALLSASMPLRRQFRAAGLANNRVALLPPAVNVDGGVVERTLARARLAESHELQVPDDAFVMGLFGEPIQSSDSFAAATIAARIALAGRRVRLVVHPAAHRRMAAQDLLRNLKLDDVLIVDPIVATPWRIVHGVDAAILFSHQSHAQQIGSVQPLLWAIATGTPFVAELTDSSRELIVGDLDDLLVDADDVSGAADRVMRLLDEPAYGQSVASRAQQMAKELYGIEDYCERLQHAYDLLMAHRSVRFLGDSRTSDIAAEEIVTV